MSSAASSSASTPATAGGAMQQLIHRKLSDAFEPLHLTILNESYMHAGPRDAESHFKVIVVSKKFESLTLIARHRAVNTVLADELKNGIHALSITARTPQQWEADQTVHKSPPCAGGQLVDESRAFPSPIIWLETRSIETAAVRPIDPSPPIDNTSAISPGSTAASRRNEGGDVHPL